MHVAAGVRLERPGVRRRGAERRVARAASPPRSTRRSRRSSRTCPRARCWRRSPAAARRCASALRRALEHDRPRPRDPHPRQPPPRRPALDGHPTGSCSTSRAARSQRRRAPAQALAAARRREHAALVRLRRLGDGADRAAAPPPEGWEEQARENFLRGYFSVVGAERLRARRRGRRARSCSRSSSSRRPSTSCATSSRCGPSGSRSRWPRSSACSRSRSASSVGTWQCAGIFGIVLAGGEGKRLLPLTLDRAKPAVPFGGNYRLVDFALSNLVNAGYLKIAVLTQYKSHSLDRHITTTWRLSPLLGNYVTPVPAQQRRGPRWFAGLGRRDLPEPQPDLRRAPRLRLRVRRRPHLPHGSRADGRASTSRPAPA